jgi:DNA polymerase I-like protein with 3'-5' exonuclease and polymerase domains
MKKKMVELDAAGLGPFFRLSVHDELIYEAPIDIAGEVRHVLDQVMPDRHSFPGVVLESESDAVARWGSHYRDDYPVYVATEDDSWAYGIGADV